ncbi:MAG: carbon starvation protein A [Gemmataceae bacterium]
MDLFCQEAGDHVLLRAMPIILGVLCVFVIAYRYYSLFLARKVAQLDDARVTPAHQFNDGQNYHPTNKWVLFGHHFAAISGAGPLIGPVLAIQYGYMPGLLWLVIGVCLAGAVQDMLVLAASVRRGGKSLAQIAFTELGRGASLIVCLAILVIVVIALAGLGFVVVKALGGEEVNLAPGTVVTLPKSTDIALAKETEQHRYYDFPQSTKLHFPGAYRDISRPEAFSVRVAMTSGPLRVDNGTVTLPEKTQQIIPGSAWGTFTIACTIPIALLVSLWMYRIRPGRVTEASLIGAAGVIGATILGGLIPGSALEPYFSLDRTQTIFALCAYGFIASVLPVWLLLCPRDYISSFLKIGTIAILVIGVILANPTLRNPPINESFAGGGPIFAGSIFPFVFICVMCGAISGFHALVSSGTTPKMIDKESHIRPIGYGAMLMEGLVGVVALIAAASLPIRHYMDINVDADKAADVKLQQKMEEMYKRYALPPLVGARDLPHLDLSKKRFDIDTADLNEIGERVGGEYLRGRTGGAVTLAVGMAGILTTAMERLDLAFEDVMKYWYHFAIMFEALFILTTIDTGTRIARFLMQETLGKAIPQFEKTDWLPGALLATLTVTLGWGLLVSTGSIGTIWPMFGIANQLLAVLALCLVSTLLFNSGRGKYAILTIMPMAFVTTTTMTAGVQLSQGFVDKIQNGKEGEALAGVLNLGLTLFVMASVGTILVMAVGRWLGVGGGMVEARKE